MIANRDQLFEKDKVKNSCIEQHLHIGAHSMGIKRMKVSKRRKRVLSTVKEHDEVYE